MEISRSTFILIQVALAIIGLAAGIATVYFIHNQGLEARAADTRRMAEVYQLQARAERHFDRLLDYGEVCREIAAGRDHSCHASQDAYAVETRLSTGRYYCADSTGFIGERAGSKGAATACPR